MHWITPLLTALLISVSVASAPSLNVTVTAYTAAPGETDRNPSMSRCGKTFSGQVAVSRDLLRRFPCGSRLRLTVAGRTRTVTVNDTMAARWTMKVDVLMASRQAALNFGRQSGSVQ